MPTELRKIVFNENELYEAVMALHLQTATRLPQGPLEQVKVKGSDLAFVVLAYGAIDPSPARSLSFTKDQVAAGLIAYCRDKRIPIPRKGQKLLKVEDGKVVYMVRVGADVSRRR